MYTYVSLRPIRPPFLSMTVGGFYNFSFDISPPTYKYCSTAVPYVLQLLLHSIHKSSPFFICLLGQQYGPYFEKKDTKLIYKDKKRINWIEKNLLVASKTGFSNIVNPMTYHNSFLEFQINTALSLDQSYPYYRFYCRQSEYFEDKYHDLPAEEYRKMIASFEAENSYCDSKIKELKILPQRSVRGNLI